LKFKVLESPGKISLKIPRHGNLLHLCPRPALIAHSAPLAGFEGPASKGRGGRTARRRRKVFLYISAFVGSEKVLENFSWGSWKVLDIFVSKRVETLDYEFIMYCKCESFMSIIPARIL